MNKAKIITQKETNLAFPFPLFDSIENSATVIRKMMTDDDSRGCNFNEGD